MNINKTSNQLLLDEKINENSIIDPKKFVIYTFPILIIVGTICNILTFLVMRRKKLRNQSTGFYMAVLAIADELALLVGCLTYWLHTYKKFTILHISTITCKIFSVILYTTMDFSVWMIVIMTIERFIAVAFPLRSMYFCTVKKAKLATLVLTSILFSINSHFLFTHSLVTRHNDTGCQSKSETYDYFIENYWTWIDAIKYSFIPLITIILFNVLIIYNLIRASTSIKNLSSNHKLQISRSTTTQVTQRLNKTSNYNNNQNTSSSSSINNNRRLTIMLLVVSITFCILSSPLLLLQILQRAKSGSANDTFYTICLLLQYFNHSINFFLYVISGKLFRREFIALLCDSMICFKSKIKGKKEKITLIDSIESHSFGTKKLNNNNNNNLNVNGNKNLKPKITNRNINNNNNNKDRDPLVCENEKESMLSVKMETNIN